MISPGANAAVQHGVAGNEPYWAVGFRFGNVSYIPDVSRIPEETRPLLRGTDVMILDALSDRSHTSHFSFAEAVDHLRLFRPRLGLLTGFSHSLEHREMEERLRKVEEAESLDVRPAYDGMRVDLSRPQAVAVVKGEQGAAASLP
ncbi:MAG: hypothetical protein BJ554DRAFT_5624 [Olpidium bornovanus]|uniref:Metallo-beta-lactamase domain-containing protein n=1 Tax=Olpidium bornovanus TaxID=278681 RepID=A0A8H8DKW1_9FUNG|nr:MAG: hypothetical protein BJ554DRAFT_5624 [Olpidium bornovanus]